MDIYDKKDCISTGDFIWIVKKFTYVMPAWPGLNC